MGFWCVWAVPGCPGRRMSVSQAGGRRDEELGATGAVYLLPPPPSQELNPAVPAIPGVPVPAAQPASPVAPGWLAGPGTSGGGGLPYFPGWLGWPAGPGASGGGGPTLLPTPPTHYGKSLAIPITHPVIPTTPGKPGLAGLAGWAGHLRGGEPTLLSGAIIPAAPTALPVPPAALVLVVV